LVTTTDTTVTGAQTSCDTARRCRHDTFGYLVDGKLSSVAVDCKQEAELADDCFEECGLGTISYENSAHHCCAQSGDCDCTSFEDAEEGICGPDCMSNFACVDPDQDIENRINHEIRKTISDVLSEIVETAICGSMKHTIDLDEAEED
jgi:hypothetical protein